MSGRGDCWSSEGQHERGTSLIRELRERGTSLIRELRERGTSLDGEPREPAETQLLLQVINLETNVLFADCKDGSRTQDYRFQPYTHNLTVCSIPDK